ncbi:alpha-(1,3)-fucosyltransferase 10 [Octopus bimaculoides]|uniref:alpha-(1,3)-fucosyltransferase 10 n=1 Tax=Octopus bimaculoides TaxID=37653 RepID=UPI0022E77317|nr:alpha-(1,3)-fucosyltransferase 10 [Octopus bimaculoides]
MFPVVRQCLFRYFLVAFLIIFAIIMILGFTMLITGEEKVFINEPMVFKEVDHHKLGSADALQENIAHPIILWWTKFTGEQFNVFKCKNVTCVFTEDRHYKNHPNTKVSGPNHFLLFIHDLLSKYGSCWAVCLFVFIIITILSGFFLNYFFVYNFSLVDPINGMSHKDFYKLIAKYKFAFSMENGICDDYMTEKLWRPLMVGTVPVILGSSKVRDFLPHEKSAIIIDDFDTAESLAKYLLYLNRNDEEYEKYLQWKKTGITNKYLKDLMAHREWYSSDEGVMQYNGISYIEGFQCFVCQRIHKNMRLEKEGKMPKVYQATLEHYGCPAPIQFNAQSQRVDSDKWKYEWQHQKMIAEKLRHSIDNGNNFTWKDANIFLHN